MFYLQSSKLLHSREYNFIVTRFRPQQKSLLKMKFLPLLVLFVIFSCVSVDGGPVTNGTRDISSLYDCKWVTKCAAKPQAELFYTPCENWLDPKYECTLKPTVDLSKPPCIHGYVLNEKNKCINILS